MSLVSEIELASTRVVTNPSPGSCKNCIEILFKAFNDTPRGKLQFSTRICQNKILSALNPFDMFAQSINLYTFPYHILKSADI